MRKKVVVITGATKGIGKATYQLLAARGDRPIGLARRAPKKPAFYSVDVQNEQSVQQVFRTILKKYKRIDGLVNSAGVASFSPALKIPPEEWATVLQTNLLGSYWTSKHALAAMLKQKYGRIVNVSSIAGERYSKSASLAYTCSKAAVLGLTRQMALQFGQKGININCVCPSQTRTEMLLDNVPVAAQRQLAQINPLKRLAEPKEVAEVIAFLVSEKASYVNGAILDVNGGQ